MNVTPKPARTRPTPLTRGQISSATRGTTPTFVNTGLVNGTTYYYKVAGVNTGGIGTRSAEVSARP